MQADARNAVVEQRDPLHAISTLRTIHAGRQTDQVGIPVEHMEQHRGGQHIRAVLQRLDIEPCSIDDLHDAYEPVGSQQVASGFAARRRLVDATEQEQARPGRRRMRAQHPAQRFHHVQLGAQDLRRRVRTRARVRKIRDSGHVHIEFAGDEQGGDGDELQPGGRGRQLPAHVPVEIVGGQVARLAGQAVLLADLLHPVDNDRAHLRAEARVPGQIVRVQVRVVRRLTRTHALDHRGGRVQQGAAAHVRLDPSRHTGAGAVIELAAQQNLADRNRVGLDPMPPRQVTGGVGGGIPIPLGPPRHPNDVSRRRGRPAPSAVRQPVSGDPTTTPRLFPAARRVFAEPCL